MARGTWRSACLRAGLHDGGRHPKPNATIHDLRHTFGVHAAKAGVPIARLQTLLGHATPAMTMRYMKHAPQEFFGEDAAKIAASIGKRKGRGFAQTHDASDESAARQA
jgi:integrase